MTKVNCNQYPCKNNKDRVCQRKEIEVNGECWFLLECDEYKEEKK